MSDKSFSLSRILGRRPDPTERPELEANRFAEAALERHKREGLELAVRARWIALGIIAIMLPFLNPTLGVLYYEVGLLALAFVGWVQQRIGRVGQSRIELAVLFVDLALATFILTVPNPFDGYDWPTAINFRFETFLYLFVILAAGTLAYSWRTIMAIGTWTATMWIVAALLIWGFGSRDALLGAAASAAFGDDPELLKLLDPNQVAFDLRIQEVVVFVIVAYTLALTVRRFNRLLLGNAELERERENLSRYFSPNVVEELSHNDEPLKQTRMHEVAVLFVDIVGFTEFASHRDPKAVIEILRGFHSRMETEVFRHGGTLDKYLGDGLMATFGTLFPSDQDAINALRCARAMIATLADWNAERRAEGEPEIIGSFGLHFGPVVLGDIGANRLEFSVIGPTANEVARLEDLTKPLDRPILASDAFIALAGESTHGLRHLDQAQAAGAALLLVSHDARLRGQFDRELRLDGPA